MSYVSVQHCKKAMRHPVFSDINCEIAKGEFVTCSALPVVASPRCCAALPA